MFILSMHCIELFPVSSRHNLSKQIHDIVLTNKKYSAVKGDDPELQRAPVLKLALHGERGPTYRLIAQANVHFQRLCHHLQEACAV